MCVCVCVFMCMRTRVYFQGQEGSWKISPCNYKPHFPKGKNLIWLTCTCPLRWIFCLFCFSFSFFFSWGVRGWKRMWVGGNCQWRSLLLILIYSAGGTQVWLFSSADCSGHRKKKGEGMWRHERRREKAVLLLHGRCFLYSVQIKVLNLIVYALFFAVNVCLKICSQTHSYAWTQTDRKTTHMFWGVYLLNSADIMHSSF